MRGLMGQTLGTQAAVAKFAPMLERQAQRFVWRVMRAKTSLKDAIQR
jgi:hypothetical protein